MKNCLLSMGSLVNGFCQEVTSFDVLGGGVNTINVCDVFAKFIFLSLKEKSQ